MAPHRIFVVEDEEMIRDSIVEFLAEQGYDVVGAADGRDALDKLDDSDPPPCLILLDLMMPVMDGAEFRRLQLADPALAAIPVILITAAGLEPIQRSDYSEVLRKPLKVDRVLAVIAEYC
jgi:CheY-like chemotaxis protein